MIMSRAMLRMIFIFFLGMGLANAEDLKLYPEMSNRYCAMELNGTPYLRLVTNSTSNPLIIKILDGQKILPLDPEVPSIFQNNFTHLITLKNLSGTDLPGSIAFDTIYLGTGSFTTNSAVIFTEKKPKGVSKSEFLKSLPENQKKVADEILNTFLTIYPALVAAIDSCRPLKVVTYATSEETDRIENGRKRYFQMTKKFNNRELKPIISKGNGISAGFYDPDFRIETRYGVTLDFEYLNPLRLKTIPRELSASQCEKIVNGAKARSDAPTDKTLFAEFLYKETFGRCK